MFHSNDKLKVDWLSDVAFFEGFSETELAAVAQLGHRREIDQGAVLVDQGRFGTECYVVVSGSAVVRQGGQYITAVGPGTVVGEMALVEHRPRNASVVAETDMVVVSFGIREFSELLSRSMAANARVTELLNQRIHENEERR